METFVNNNHIHTYNYNEAYWLYSNFELKLLIFELEADGYSFNDRILISGPGECEIEGEGAYICCVFTSFENVACKSPQSAKGLESERRPNA